MLLVGLHISYPRKFSRGFIGLPEKEALLPKCQLTLQESSGIH
jgi:hypothetical protein